MSLNVLVSGTASDAHTWNLVLVQLVVEELGHQVANLGPCVPGELLVATIEELRPHLVVLGTVNGHGVLDGLHVIDQIRRNPDLAGTGVVIGGILGTAGRESAENVRSLKSAGFDAVFDGGGAFESFRSYLVALGAGAVA